MTWGSDLRMQIERDQLEASRLRGRLTPDEYVPRLHVAVREMVQHARRRLVKGKAA